MLLLRGKLPALEPKREPKMKKCHFSSAQSCAKPRFGFDFGGLLFKKLCLQENENA